MKKQHTYNVSEAAFKVWKYIQGPFKGHEDFSAKTLIPLMEKHAEECKGDCQSISQEKRKIIGINTTDEEYKRILKATKMSWFPNVSELLNDTLLEWGEEHGMLSP